MKVGGLYRYILNQYVKIQKVRSTGTYQYGVDDLLPNTNIKLINDSGVAKGCVTKITRYLQADGFEDAVVADVKVNKHQTANDLLAETCSYVANFKGFAWIINRKADASIASVECIPFEGVRKMVDKNGYLFNPLIGQPDYKKNDNTYHPAFNPDLDQAGLIKMLEEWDRKPEIFYWYERTADNPNYPVPDYYAGIEDIHSNIELSKADQEAIENGFMPSGILTTGEFNDTEKDDVTGKTDLEAFQDVLKSFSGQKKDANGKTGRFKLLHIQVAEGDQKPELQTYDAKAIIDASNSKRDIIDRAVCRLFGVPPVLMYHSEATILGNQSAMYNAEKSFNSYLRPLKNMITRGFEKVFGFDGRFDIGDFVLFELDERPDVKIVNENAPVDDRTAEAQATLRGSVGGVQALLGVQQSVSAGTTPPESGLKILEVIFGFDKETSKELLSVEDIKTEDGVNS